MSIKRDKTMIEKIMDLRDSRKAFREIEKLNITEREKSNLRSRWNTYNNNPSPPDTKQDQINRLNSWLIAEYEHFIKTVCVDQPVCDWESALRNHILQLENYFSKRLVVEQPMSNDLSIQVKPMVQKMTKQLKESSMVKKSTSLFDRRRKIERDGNCFFRAIDFFVKKTHETIRHEVCNYFENELQKNPTYYKNTNVTLDKIKQLREVSFWNNEAMDIVPFLTARRYKLNLTIYDHNNIIIDNYYEGQTDVNLFLHEQHYDIRQD